MPAAIVVDLLLPNYRSSVIEQYLPVAIGMTQGPLNTDVGVQGSASILLLAVAAIYNINTIYSMANIKHTCSDGLALTPVKKSFDVVYYCTVLVAVFRLTVCLSKPRPSLLDLLQRQCLKTFSACVGIVEFAKPFGFPFLSRHLIFIKHNAPL